MISCSMQVEWYMRSTLTGEIHESPFIGEPPEYDACGVCYFCEGNKIAPTQEDTQTKQC